VCYHAELLPARSPRCATAASGVGGDLRNEPEWYVLQRRSVRAVPRHRARPRDCEQHLPLSSRGATVTHPQQHRDEAEFASWNEQMVQRYDIDRYYEQSHPVVRWIEQRRLELLVELAAPRAGDRILEV